MTRPRAVGVTFEDFQEACDSYSGWCTSCEEFTTDSTEPDAEKYPCRKCGDHAVYGAEEALLLDLIVLEEE